MNIQDVHLLIAQARAEANNPDYKVWQTSTTDTLWSGDSFALPTPPVG